MTLDFDDDDGLLRIRLTGALRWNDRLRLSTLLLPLAATRNRRVLLDASNATEADRGCFGGVWATTERIALMNGLLPSLVPPVEAAQ